MRQFIKFVFASCLGTILASVVVLGIASLVMGRAVSNASQAKRVSANSILTLKLNEPIPEQTNNIDNTSITDFDISDKLGLLDMVKAIQHASSDDNIKGIFLDLNSVAAGQASLLTLRRALENFKENGKFVIAHATFYTQGSYYLASVANKVLVNPMGGVDWRGFAAQIPFFKDMLDRLGIKMQIYYAGKFKSATEPYRLNEMSDENRRQISEYLEGNYDTFLEGIAASRGIDQSELRRMADTYAIRNAQDAVDNKLVDQLAYRDQVYAEIRNRLGLDTDADIKSIAIGDYSANVKKKIELGTKGKIAVVIAEGTIVDGKGTLGSIGGDKYAKIFRKIRKDKSIDAVVLRVNSGGGSGIASDVMWRELELIKDSGKPLIVSMGDLAASGGYYIACNADSVFAEPNTITGSIGVYGMIPSFEKMLEDKVGVTFDAVKTGPFAVGLSPFVDITPEEGEIIKVSVKEFYDTFLQKVADGRGMTVDEVNEVAQGRVWTGKKAVELGLVDALGGIESALAVAAEKADLSTYRTVEYPKSKSFTEQILEKISGGGADQVLAGQVVKAQLGDLYPYFKYLQEIRDMRGVQARLPFVVSY